MKGFWLAIGFTGTRAGMTDIQKESVEGLLRNIRDPLIRQSFIHGGCTGADSEAHKIALGFGYTTRVLPSNLENWQSQECLRTADLVEAELPPLVRNKKIVAYSSVMIACPKESKEVLRSGTWATIRAARKAKHVLKLYVVNPDGSILVY